MKKSIVIILALVMALAAFTACGQVATQGSGSQTTEVQTSQEQSEQESESGQQPAAEPVDVSVVALNGPTAMGMVKFMSDAENGDIESNNYTFSIETAIDVVTPMIVQGEVDIAAVPANVASAIYNNSQGAVSVIAINTLGVLYIVEDGQTMQSVEDLKGKTINAAGKGATPEYALNQILAANNLTNEVTIEWKTEQAEVVAAIDANANSIAMLPQPFATTAQVQNENIRVALDLTEVWGSSDIGGALVTGVCVVNKEFAEQNPDAVADFMAQYEQSVNFINENVQEGAALVGQYEIVPEAVAQIAIPLCNITFVQGDEMQEMLSGYLNVLFEQNPQAIGGAMPNDDFYYANQ